MKDNKRDLNIRSAFVHFMADALVSSGVLVAGLFIALTGFLWIDSVMSFIITAVILYSTYHLLIDSINLSLDAVPDNIEIEEVRDYLNSLPEVRGVHDLHIWALGTSTSALTVHLNTKTQTDIEFIISIQHQLLQKFKIDHSTIQVEFGEEGTGCVENCN
jgi:cobalt-zinc-cadmium efflux system protein